MYKNQWLNVLRPYLFCVECLILFILIVEHPSCFKNWSSTLLKKVWQPTEPLLITPMGMVSVNATMTSGNIFSWSLNLVQLNNIGSLPCQMLSTRSDHSYQLQLTTLLCVIPNDGQPMGMHYGHGSCHLVLACYDALFVHARMMHW